VSDNAVALADYKGYVHWLDKTTGALAARVSTGKFRISNAPVVAGNLLIVINDRGRITAYRVTPLAGHAKAAVTPPAPAAKAAETTAPAPVTTPAEPTPAPPPAPTPAEPVAPPPLAAPSNDNPTPR
jgi:hypothetical protein